MLLIGIHGYLPRWADSENIGVWEGTEAIKEMIDPDNTQQIELLKLRYKDIIYKEDEYSQVLYTDDETKPKHDYAIKLGEKHITLEKRDSGFRRLLCLAVKIAETKKNAGKVIINGHSLGGWAGIHLIQEVYSLFAYCKSKSKTDLSANDLKRYTQSRGYETGDIDNLLELVVQNHELLSGEIGPVDIFTQIDALSVHKNSPIYTEDNWIGSFIANFIKLGNADADGFKNICSKFLGKFIESLIKRAIKIDPDLLIHGAQQIISTLSDNKINEKFIQNKNGNKHRFSKSKVLKQINFYCSRKMPMWLIRLSNHVVEAATDQQTGNYKLLGFLARLYFDKEIELSHSDIDGIENYADKKSIYHFILENIDGDFKQFEICIDTSKPMPEDKTNLKIDQVSTENIQSIKDNMFGKDVVDRLEDIDRSIS